jgi:hypothetical protein
VDFKFLDRVDYAVEIEPGAPPSQPDNRDHLAAHEGLHESFTDTQLLGHAGEIGELIAVIRQGRILRAHRHGFIDGRLSVAVLRVEFLDKFHDVLLFSPVGENPVNCAFGTELLTCSVPLS